MKIFGHGKLVLLSLAILFASPQMSNACWLRDRFTNNSCNTCAPAPAPRAAYYVPVTPVRPRNSCNTCSAPTNSYYAPTVHTAAPVMAYRPVVARAVQPAPVFVRYAPAPSAPCNAAPACTTCASPVTTGWQTLAAPATVAPAPTWAPVASPAGCPTCATRPGYGYSATVSHTLTTPGYATTMTGYAPTQQVRTDFVSATPWRPVTASPASLGYSAPVAALTPFGQPMQ